MPRTANDILREIRDLRRRAERNGLRLRKIHIPRADEAIFKSDPIVARMVKLGAPGAGDRIDGIPFIFTPTRERIWCETEQAL